MTGPRFYIGQQIKINVLRENMLYTTSGVVREVFIKKIETWDEPLYSYSVEVDGKREKQSEDLLRFANINWKPELV